MVAQSERVSRRKSVAWWWQSVTGIVAVKSADKKCRLVDACVFCSLIGMTCMVLLLGLLFSFIIWRAAYIHAHSKAALYTGSLGIQPGM